MPQPPNKKPVLVKPVTEPSKGRTNRVMQILDAMTVEERAEFFEEVAETYCTTCGEELPDEDSKEPDHDCPFDGEDDEDDAGGDEGDPDEEDEEEDEDIENANES